MDLAIDTATHDLAIDADGNLALVDGIDSIAQAIKIILLTGTGEWDYDLTAGVDWRRLREHGQTLGVIEAHLRQVILGVRGVVSISRVALTPNYATRQVTGQIDVVTDLGLLTVTV